MSFSNLWSSGQSKSEVLGADSHILSNLLWLFLTLNHKQLPEIHSTCAKGKAMRLHFVHYSFQVYANISTLPLAGGGRNGSVTFQAQAVAENCNKRTVLSGLEVCQYLSGYFLSAYGSKRIFSRALTAPF